MKNQTLATIDTNSDTTEPVLVLGATGKTGRRVVSGLKEQGVPFRIGSRTATPAFDWHNEAGWDRCLKGVTAVFICYSPDLAIPGATDVIEALVRRAKQQGVARLVLLSGRGEPEAQRCEQLVLQSGLEATIVRASWFNQNFSEGAFIHMIRSGQITLPAGDTPEPFIDVDDIAEVAVAALTEPGHAGEVYEVTGPESLTFTEVARELSSAVGRPIEYIDVPHDAFIAGIADSGAPQDVIWIMDYLFSTILDGRNASPGDGVQRALNRPPKPFSQSAREVAATGVWTPADTNPARAASN